GALDKALPEFGSQVFLPLAPVFEHRDDDISILLFDGTVGVRDWGDRRVRVVCGSADSSEQRGGDSRQEVALAEGDSRQTVDLAEGDSRQTVDLHLAEGKSQQMVDQVEGKSQLMVDQVDGESQQTANQRQQDDDGDGGEREDRHAFHCEGNGRIHPGRAGEGHEASPKADEEDEKRGKHWNRSTRLKVRAAETRDEAGGDSLLRVSLQQKFSSIMHVYKDVRLLTVYGKSSMGVLKYKIDDCATNFGASTRDALISFQLGVDAEYAVLTEGQAGRAGTREHGTRVMFTPSAAANETAVSDDLKDEGGVRDCRWMQAAQKLLKSNK
ncbi:hypothetical protein THAOC_25284, partial [Thalassiosira oceanica]